MRYVLSPPNQFYCQDHTFIRFSDGNGCAHMCHMAVHTLLFLLGVLRTVHFVCCTLFFWLDITSCSFYTCLSAELSF